MLNGDTVPLWQAALREDSEVACCPRPPSPPGPPTIQAHTFNGFGYLMVDPGDFVIASQSNMAFQFRTFDPDAILFLLESSVNLESYYGIFLQGGFPVFALQGDETVGGAQTVYGSRIVNDGQWYQVRDYSNDY